ncbi:MAG: ribulose-phosphate 3-epimerase [Ignavibacteriae bacterium]|nr:ribulose-phosphate 3-epimerase [Ignavibacteria bacterium]MBI3365551.1 ribulose-phosphate 3-epimerase [Ignavibacteriota bacterium]
MLKIAPSLLSADFRNLEKQIRLIERGEADWVHLDIMDGHFVPNITFGPAVVKAVRKLTKLSLDAHLMIEKPERYLKAFKNAGVDRLTVHVEACQHLRRTVQQIKKLGMKAGVTLKPATPAKTLKNIMPYVDLVLVMTVHPGFSGQKFIESMLPKIREVAGMIRSSGRAIELEVDGGVDEHNAAALIRAGATVLVAGYSIFSRRSIPSAIKRLRNAAQA